MRFVVTYTFHLLLMMLALCEEARGVLWTHTLGDVINTCTHSDITFPWGYQLGSGDVVQDIEWYFSNARSEEVIASYIHGQFLAYPAFSGRVSLTGNAGIVLLDLVPGDSGSYSVILHGHNASGMYFDLRQTVALNVSDKVMTQRGRLIMYQSPYPVMDISSGHWAIELSCGNFAFNGTPSYDVEWIFPNGVSQNSTAFHGGYFRLLLTNPVQGGYYNCRVPEEHSCVNGQGLITAEASVHVDAVDVRLRLLEKMVSEENVQLQQLKDYLFYSLPDPHVRLMNGSNATEGRVEMWTGSTWGTVCDDGWEREPFASHNAKVVCSMLGLPASGAVRKMQAYFGPGSGPIFLDDVACTGVETDLIFCRHSPFGKHNCAHSEDVGVICADG